MLLCFNNVTLLRILSIILPVNSESIGLQITNASILPGKQFVNETIRYWIINNTLTLTSQNKIICCSNYSLEAKGNESVNSMCATLEKRSCELKIEKL